MHSTRNGTYSKPDDAEHPLPPHNRDAERALLGSLMRDNGIISAAIALVKADEFHVSAHRDIFHAIIDVHHGGGGVDMVTVGDRINKQNLTDEIGGLAYLMDLWDAAPCAGNYRQYAEIVRGHAKRRDAQSLLQEFQRRLTDPSIPPSELIAELQSRLIDDPGAVPGFRFNPIDMVDFLAGDYRPKWIVRRLFVQNMPGVLGGPKKSLKTSILVDLTVSIATATRFLDVFEVPHPMRVAIMSGESGEYTLRETAERIMHARSIDCIPRGYIVWEFDLPQLANLIDLAELRRGLERHKIEVLIIDPLYLCLLSGNPQAGQASNLFDMGPLLMRISQVCKSVGCTPLFAHHARKNLTSTFDPLELEDLSFAGIQEFARQWILVNRRERYEPGTGHHPLWLSVGGSIGHGGLWAVDIDEGAIDDDFSGRRWDVTVQAASEHIATKVEAKDAKKSEVNAKQKQGDDTAVLVRLDKMDPNKVGVSFTKLRDTCEISDRRAAKAIIRLVEEKVLEEIAIKIEIGKGGMRDARGIRRASSDHRAGSSDQEMFG